MVKIQKNVLIPVAGLCVFALIVAAIYFNVFKIPEKYLPAKNLRAEVAVQKAIDYVNTNMLSDGTKATSSEIKNENGVYSFVLTVQGQNYDAYVTKNGKLLFAQGIPQAIELDKPLGNNSQAPAEVKKTDKPDLKIFVMSYCPYGLQAQKMYLPVYDLLKDKAAMGIYFVNYAMHGKKEIDENLRQYCIQKEQSDKFASYLKCFTADTKYTSCTTGDCVADFGKCLNSSGVDQAKLNACIAAADKQFNVTADYNDKTTWLSETYPKFEVNNDLNVQYNVQGSPTVILNDVDVSNNIGNDRSPEKLKQVICAAFNTEPEECKTSLSTDQPSTSFGAGTASTTGEAGSCN